MHGPVNAKFNSPYSQYCERT